MTRLISYTLLLLLVVSCSKTPSGGNISKRVADESESADTADAIDARQSIIFGVPIHLDESIALKELADAGVLTVDSGVVDGQFKFAIIEFAGVKFGVNPGFLFLTSKQDKATIDVLVSEISKYYGKPIIDDYGEPEWSYYHWNLHDPHNVHIMIRPLHSENVRGLVMAWDLYRPRLDLCTRIRRDKVGTETLIGCGSSFCK